VIDAGQIEFRGAAGTMVKAPGPDELLKLASFEQPR
jgi:hypothetical protein